MTNAQLYFDSQDPSNLGWWLRYYDEHGTEQGIAIDADADASTERLAALVEDEAHWIGDATGAIAVYRGDERRGSITIADGKVTSWRAA